MLDTLEYNTDDNDHQGNGNQGNGHNGYDKLKGDWALFYKVASGFNHKVKPEDREDFLHDLILVMAKVKVKYDQMGRPLTKAGLIRVACYERAQYWRVHFKRVNGIDCSRCSKAQRAKCKEYNLYRECPKAIKLDSLDRLVEDGNGDSTPLCELIADDSADFIPRLDARLILEGYPHRFVKLAYKKHAGYRLTDSEAHYYWRERKKAQKKLIEAS
ncbi:MAG: hypothetical protein PHI12_09650 [Dehalococcoidales bacterium]|nr:hypothetical protein [Dehalococcoidales bacterium]